MSMNEEHILREQYPAQPLIPALDEKLEPELSEQQITFLRHAIRDIPSDAIDFGAWVGKRVTEVQRRAYETYPYPCIRGFRYVALRMSKLDTFARILEAGQSADPPVFLDIGCCMGTDLRYLAYSGYPTSALIGCDLRQSFIDLGHELYGDRDACAISFIVGDILDVAPYPFPSPSPSHALELRNVQRLDDLRGRVKYVFAGSLFHLYDEGTQEAIARRIATLLDLTPGSRPAVIFGRHEGNEVEGEMEDYMHAGRVKYAQSPASWERMWQRVVGDARPMRVDAILRPGPTESSGKNTQFMWWSVWIG